MARTKQTGRKSLGGKAPRKQVYIFHIKTFTTFFFSLQRKQRENLHQQLEV